MGKKQIEVLITLLNRAGVLKEVKRTGWVLEGVKDAESVADHTWRMSLLISLLAPKTLNREKVEHAFLRGKFGWNPFVELANTIENFLDVFLHVIFCKQVKIFVFFKPITIVIGFDFFQKIDRRFLYHNLIFLLLLLLPHQVHP
jgi:hypothetical protein